MALEVRDLRFRYPDGSEALRGVSFSIGEGECVGLIGPNGAGKSTLLLHLNGILPERHAPTAERGSLPWRASLPPARTKPLRRGEGPASRDWEIGEAGRREARPPVLVFGQPIVESNLPDVRRAVGMLFQDPDDQLFCPTVFEDVAFGPEQFGMDGAGVAQRVRASLAQVGLEDFGKRSPRHLSRGEKRRVCLAGVLACEPRLLVLDEPTSDLDPRGRRELKSLLRQVPATKIIATHDLELVVELCSRAILLDGGKIVADGPTARLLSDEPLMLAHGLERPHILQHRHPH